MVLDADTVFVALPMATATWASGKPICAVAQVPSSSLRLAIATWAIGKRTSATDRFTALRFMCPYSVLTHCLQGILYSPTNQKIYEGQWWKNMRNGQGSVWNLDGSSYHGEWVNNMKDGYGKKLWIDMSSYEGMWKLDKKHAMGSEKLANGDYYTGTIHLLLVLTSS